MFPFPILYSENDTVYVAIDQRGTKMNIFEFHKRILWLLIRSASDRQIILEVVIIVVILVIFMSSIRF